MLIKCAKQTANKKTAPKQTHTHIHLYRLGQVKANSIE